MATVGIRELKEHTSAVLRRVREQGETIDVTLRGRVVARLVPVPPPADADALAAWWAEHERLAEEVGKHWKSDLTAAEAVAEGRREL